MFINGRVRYFVRLVNRIECVIFDGNFNRNFPDIFRIDEIRPSRNDYNKVRGDSFQQLETVKRVKGIRFNSNGHEVGNIWRIAERQTIQFSRISIHDTTRFPELIAGPYDF